MLMVTNSFVVIVLNSFLLPITEEVRVGTSQRTISTCVMPGPAQQVFELAKVRGAGACLKILILIPLK